LGCGIGNTLWIALANSAKKVYGFEISKERVKIGKKILNEPETFLGKKDKEGIFNYLKLHKRLYQPISKYNQMLEDACETLKRSKNLVEIEAADIFSPHISQKIKNKISESDMMYVNIPAIFINFAGKQKLREDRVRTFFSLLNNAKTIIGIVGIQLNEAQWELLEEMPWEPPIFDLKMRIYKRKE
jgi:hypothetical protein